MSKEGEGRVVSQGRSKTRYITVPSTVATDSNFPFNDGEVVKITINPEKSRVIISKVEE